MGKANAEGNRSANMLLFVDESGRNRKNKAVTFNLRGIKRFRITGRTTTKSEEDLQVNLEKFYLHQLAGGGLNRDRADWAASRTAGLS